MKKLKLCLIGIKKYTRRDGDPGIKLIFLSEAGSAMPAYILADELTPEIESSLSPTGEYDDSIAREYVIDQDIFDGKLTYRVVL